jgi:hypothetical protein
MHDLAAILAVHSSGNVNAAAIGKRHCSAVAGLAAACCIENRLVENDPATLVDAIHLRRAGGEVGVLLEQSFTHAASGSTLTSGTSTGRSSHAGTGRSFERRKAGL